MLSLYLTTSRATSTLSCSHLLSFVSRALASTSALAAAGSSKPSATAARVSERAVQEVRSRVFGTHIGDDRKSGRKVLSRRLKGHAMVNWYWTPPRGCIPGFHNEEIEYAEVKRESLAQSGRRAPKKGQGKRSKK